MSRAILTTLRDPQDRSHWDCVREGWEAYARRYGAVVVEHVPPGRSADPSRREEIAAAAERGFDQVLLIDPWVRVSSQAPSIFDAEPLGPPRAVAEGGRVHSGVWQVSPRHDKVVPTRTEDVRPLDPRFNRSWDLDRRRRFPFLLSCPGHSYLSKCVGQALAGAHFLNYAGATSDLPVEPRAAGIVREQPTAEARGPRSGAPVRAVALFLYNRPDLTARVFEAIRAARPRRLFLIADGPDTPRNAVLCARARQGLGVDWECEVYRDFSTAHLGQRRRMESGFRFVFDRVDEVIFLEDDTLPSPDFFPFCEELLEVHRHDARVLSIGGSALHFGLVQSDASYEFSRYPMSWGWATWKRAIEKYQPPPPRASSAVDTLPWLLHVFGDRRTAAYWAHIFEPARGEPAWDYVWMWSSLMADGLHAVSLRNLVTNLGFRLDATHTNRDSAFSNLPLEPMDFPVVRPPRLQACPDLDAFLEETIYSGNLARALETVRRQVRDHRARAR